MKIGVPYCIGDGPVLIDVPLVDANGMSTASKAILFEGDARNAYYAAMAVKQEPDKG